MSAGFWQRADRFGRSLLPGFTVLLLIVFGALPWSVPFLGALAPPLGLLGVVFWTLRYPELLTPLALFLLGVLQDLLAGFPLGVCALMFVCTHLICAGRIRQLVGGSFFLNWLVLAAASSAAVLIQGLVFAILHGSLVPLSPLTLQLALMTGAYPIVVRLLLFPVAEYLPNREELV